MRELQKRKAETGGMRAAGAINSKSRVPNASARVPKPQQEFAALRQQVQKRKEDFFKRLNAPATRPSAVRPSAMRDQQQPLSVTEVKKIRLGLVSKTLPPDYLRQQQQQQQQQTRSGPTVRAVSMTRRVDGSPVRRARLQEDKNNNRLLLPAIASVHIGRRAAVVAGTSRR
jgi:hypothetical protein